MAVTQNDCAGVGGHEYSGLSTDEKPTNGVAVNALFLELDTGKFYYFDGGYWQEVGGNA